MKDLKHKYNLEHMLTNRGERISEISENQPVLLIFLRHFGCTFCIKALTDIKDLKDEIESLGTKIVFVHMSSQETVQSYFDQYNIEDPEHISDPTCQFYNGFGLLKGNFRQIFGLTNWIKGFQNNNFDRIKDAKELGDTFQMPGVFLVDKGEVVKSFIHNRISDRPDYIALATAS